MHYRESYLLHCTRDREQAAIDQAGNSARIEMTLTNTIARMRLPSSGHKRRFGAAGIINILATNLLLQLLLASHSSTIAMATLISQVFNGLFGYIMYGKWVFRCNAITKWRLPLAYAALMSFLWCINTAGIQSLSSAGPGISRNLAALAMVAPLAILSYAVQKYLIFRP